MHILIHPDEPQSPSLLLGLSKKVEIEEVRKIISKKGRDFSFLELIKLSESIREVDPKDRRSAEAHATFTIGGTYTAEKLA